MGKERQTSIETTKPSMAGERWSHKWSRLPIPTQLKNTSRHSQRWSLRFEEYQPSKKLWNFWSTSRDCNQFNPQPDSVNDQLQQLYLDLELEGFSAKLSLESTSGSSGEDENILKKKRSKKIKYSKLVLIYEENCPLPSDWTRRFKVNRLISVAFFDLSFLKNDIVLCQLLLILKYSTKLCKYFCILMKIKWKSKQIENGFGFVIQQVTHFPFHFFLLSKKWTFLKLCLSFDKVKILRFSFVIKVNYV